MLFEGYNLNDFRVSNLNGEDFLTGILLRKQKGYIINDHYEIDEVIPLRGHGFSMNLHDFHPIENGTKVLSMTTRHAKATKAEMQAIGEKGSCTLLHCGFFEYNATTWETLFDWSSEGRIHPDETFVEPQPQCKRGKKWDYLHANSVDKLPDGDYVYSGRLTDTIYKISAKDKSIVWRLGGKFSDFKFDGHFSGQHHVRVVSQNETHTVISMLDNAIRPGEPHITHPWSRGMIIALRTDTQPMTAHVVKTYNHPQGAHSPGRGNFQLMESGNMFGAWWNNSRISEHSPDGKLVMEAQLKCMMRSYRAYKFPWVGKPKSPPDVYSMAVASGSDGDLYSNVTTRAFASWNGATEVARWSLYGTDANGRSRKWLSSVPRNGFETEISYRGYASHIMVEAVDKAHHVLGKSEVFETVGSVEESFPEPEPKPVDSSSSVFPSSSSSWVASSSMASSSSVALSSTHKPATIDPPNLTPTVLPLASTLPTLDQAYDTNLDLEHPATDDAGPEPEEPEEMGLTAFLQTPAAFYIIAAVSCINTVLFVTTICCLRKRRANAGPQWSSWRQKEQLYDAVADNDMDERKEVDSEDEDEDEHTALRNQT